MPIHVVNRDRSPTSLFGDSKDNWSLGERYRTDGAFYIILELAEFCHCRPQDDKTCVVRC